MKFFENSFNYDYSFSAVSLAYFLRYPNPYSRHVLTSDVIDRYVDPVTNRLHTTRLHLKRSKIPSAMLKLLPKGIGGAENAGQSFILETSVVDPNEGWMETESRNMEWTGILSVVEKQIYRRQALIDQAASGQGPSSLPIDDRSDEKTAVKTRVIFKSRLGQGMMRGRSKHTEASGGDGRGEEDVPKRGLLASWSATGIQRTIEIIGVKRTSDAILRSKQGMNVVLERLRRGGIVAVLDGMRRDREATLGSERRWKRVWLHGSGGGQGHPRIDIDHLDDDG
jgi:hypothetical protein